MAWAVVVLENVVAWYQDMSEAEKDDFEVAVDLLEQHGPILQYPWSSQIRGSKLRTMRELRYQHGGDPYRVLYVFDPERQAVLLLGGNKGGNARWYIQNIPKAERLYQQYLDEKE
jgi:hypothetical protein